MEADLLIAFSLNFFLSKLDRSLFSFIPSFSLNSSHEEDAQEGKTMPSGRGDELQPASGADGQRILVDAS